MNDYDLSQIPTEVLQEELDKRRALKRAEREEERKNRVGCDNCAHRIYGPAQRSLCKYETWVCELRPLQTKHYYFSSPVPYNKAYRVCTRLFDGCEMFLHKDSEEGKKLVKKHLEQMRMEDYDR